MRSGWSVNALNPLAPCMLTGLLALAPAAMATNGDPARGEKLAYTCKGCHGIENYKNAYPNYSVPKLGGQHEAYIVAALAQYESGARSHPTMRGYAILLSEQDGADLAAYFNGVTPPLASAGPNGTLPEQAAICVTCHGRNGPGTQEVYPRLSGQHADYLARSLNDYRLGKRNNPIMQPFAQQLTQDDIRALAEYFSNQKGLETPDLD